jgi:hypothetical protein
MRIMARAFVVAIVASVSLAACSSSSPPSATAGSVTPPDSSIATPAAAASQHPNLDRWNAAYTYLSTQTKPTQIVCNWWSADGSRPSPAPRPARFYRFSESAAWKEHLITRNDPYPRGTFDYCVATVPTTVPYGPEIATFLSQFGLRFVADRTKAEGLTPIEIAYAGANADDPDIIYRDKPGLFGLRMALAGLGDGAFKPGTTEIVQPTDEATAARYLRYARPLLDWYQYKS